MMNKNKLERRLFGLPVEYDGFHDDYKDRCDGCADAIEYILEGRWKDPKNLSALDEFAQMVKPLAGMGMLFGKDVDILIHDAVHYGAASQMDVYLYIEDFDFDVSPSFSADYCDTGMDTYFEIKYVYMFEGYTPARRND